MNATDLQDALVNLIDTLADARDEMEGDDDAITLADYLRDIDCDFEDAISARTYARDQMLTTDAGVTLRTKDGAEFQITIVQTKRGKPEDGSDDEG